MGMHGHVVTHSEWERCSAQLRALHKDWHYLYKLIEEYIRSRFDRRSLEVAFLELKARISCDYPILTEWRAIGCGLHAAIDNIFDHGCTLKSLAEEARAGDGRTTGEWHMVDASLGKIRQGLIEAREKTKPGKPIVLPPTIFHVDHATHDAEHLACQLKSFRADWRRIYELMQASLHPNADQACLEAELIQLKSKISCDYPTLPRWFGGRDEISSGIGRILSNNATLASIAQEARNGGRTGMDWLAVDDSVHGVCAALNEARGHNGDGSDIVNDFFTPRWKPRWNIRKILIRVAVFCLVLFTIFTAYVMRTYLGYGAPDAGEGIEVNASLEDTEKVSSILAVMNEACVRGDVDMFMTTIARDFEDDEGNGRRALRVIVQAYHATGNMTHAWIDWDRMRVTRKDEWIYAVPVLIRSDLEDEDLITLRIGFKQYGDKWLIAFAEGHN